MLFKTAKKLVSSASAVQVAQHAVGQVAKEPVRGSRFANFLVGAGLVGLTLKTGTQSQQGAKPAAPSNGRRGF